MPVIVDAVDRPSPEFAANRDSLLAQLDTLKARLAETAEGGPEAARTRQTARGKLLPRARIALLLDAGSPFLELAPLAAFGLYRNEVPAAGVIAGVGRVSGRNVMIV